MKKLRSIKEFAFGGIQSHHGADRKYVSRLFEGLGTELPVEPEDNIWKKRYDEGKSIKMSFDFSDREKMKDFVSSVQELEDRMQHFSKMIIEKNAVIVECQVSSVSMLSDRVKDFFSTVSEIKEGLDGR